MILWTLMVFSGMSWISLTQQQQQFPNAPTMITKQQSPPPMMAPLAPMMMRNPQSQGAPVIPQIPPPQPSLLPQQPLANGLVISKPPMNSPPVNAIPPRPPNGQPPPSSIFFK